MTLARISVHDAIENSAQLVQNLRSRYRITSGEAIKLIELHYAMAVRENEANQPTGAMSQQAVDEFMDQYKAENIVPDGVTPNEVITADTGETEATEEAAA